MTEDEWNLCGDQNPMLEFLRGTAGFRQLRLLLCGAVRLLPEAVISETLWDTLAVAEDFADGRMSIDELNVWRGNRAIPSRTDGVGLALRHFSGLLVCGKQRLWEACKEYCAHTVRTRIATVSGPDWERNRDQRVALLKRERPLVAGLVRDIFGNPFRRVSLDPSWLTSDVRGIAEGIYADHAFGRLPILADALQDAGCDNADILDHCRSDGPHVRGCWVVDLILGKV